MGDLKTLAKARMELEELYLGIPDDSVNLTFQDLADVTHNANGLDKKNSSSSKVMNPIQEDRSPSRESHLRKLPSLDFNNGLRASRDDHNYRHHHHPLDRIDQDSAGFDSFRSRSSHHPHHHGYDDHQMSHRGRSTSPTGHRPVPDMRHGSDDVSMLNMASMASTYQDRGARRRPGIPHSNICTVCSTYIYIFRHRCLVCGRVYCRQCVAIGMGEMAEGRKCIQCLGRRFSQRYIQRAGEVGCCSRYPSSVKQMELKWAEKGPRRSGERAYAHSGLRSRSRSPVTPSMAHGSINMTPSFVASPAYSPYTPTHHHLPI